MKNFYTVSEIAEFFKISRQTLIYYDKIDVFKPAFTDEENGYRYYSRNQFSELSFIISLKEAGFSLNNIKEYFKSRNPKESMTFLKEKIKSIESKIEELSKSKEILERKVTDLQKILESGVPAPIVEKSESIKVVYVKLQPPYDDLEYEKAAIKLNNIIKKFPFETMQFFSAVSKKDIDYGSQICINYIGARVPMDFEYTETKILEGGTFVSMEHLDIYDNVRFTYYKILDFIKENSYEIIGDSRETIGDLREITSDAILFLGKGTGGYMKIQIPVRETKSFKKK